MNNDPIIYQGDDLRAFTGTPFMIIITNHTGQRIKKLVFTCGNLVKTFEDLPEFDQPNFTITVYFTDKETRLLRKTQKAFVACYDELGRKKTCEGSFVLNTHEEVVYDERNQQ